MKRLYLASHASRLIYDIIRRYGLNPIETKVAFIPNAADHYQDPWFMKQDHDTLKELGFQIKVIDLNQTRDSFLYDQLCKVDVIFTAGGNTFDLLAAAQESGFLSQAKGRIDDGVLYIGSGAGSVLAASDLSPVRNIDKIRDELELDSLSGLGLVDFLPLPHLGNVDYSQSFASLFASDQAVWQPIIAFSDFQAVVVEGDSFRIIEQSTPRTDTK